jgi:ketosteroid isomerase-like protein
MMTPTESSAQEQEVQAREFYEHYRALLVAGDFRGLLADCYTADARLHSFRFRAQGTEAIRKSVALYRQRVIDRGISTIESFAAGGDFIWVELKGRGNLGDIELYEFQFLREGRIYLHLIGEKQGNLWQSDDFAGAAPVAGPVAHRLHERYIAYQANHDADGLADDFFTADARLITAKVQVAGREALRSFFGHKLQEESEFHLESTRNIAGDADYVWFEATAGGSRGMRTVYDVMLLQGGQVAMQLVGTLAGVLPANVRSPG